MDIGIAALRGLAYIVTPATYVVGAIAISRWIWVSSAPLKKPWLRGLACSFPLALYFAPTPIGMPALFLLAQLESPYYFVLATLGSWIVFFALIAGWTALSAKSRT